MTFFHLVNCAVLSFAPFVITYKYSGLNEYSSFWRCAQGAGGYFLTQLVKLLLLATFFPAGDNESFSLVPELLKSTADIVDVIGLHIVMTNFLAGKGEVRFLSGGLGWGAAHSVASRLVLLWVGARASAFSWRWMQTSVDSSSDLVLFMALAAATWMAPRATGSRHLVYLCLIACVYHTFVYQLLASTLLLHGWTMVASRAAYSIAVAFTTFYAYSNSGPLSLKRD